MTNRFNPQQGQDQMSYTAAVGENGGGRGGGRGSGQVTTQAYPENGGGSGGHFGHFPGFAPPKAGNGGGTATTMAVGENGGGGSTRPPSPTPYRPPGDGGGTATTMAVGENGGGGSTRPPSPTPYRPPGDGGPNIQDVLDRFEVRPGLRGRGNDDRGPMNSTGAVGENGGGNRMAGQRFKNSRSQKRDNGRGADGQHKWRL